MRPPKRPVPRSLTELRAGYRASAIRAFGACTVYRLAERAGKATVTPCSGQGTLGASASCCSNRPSTVS